MPSLGLLGKVALSMWIGARRFGAFHLNERGNTQSLTWRKMKWTDSFGLQIPRANMAEEITPCS